MSMNCIQLLILNSIAETPSFINGSWVVQQRMPESDTKMHAGIAKCVYSLLKVSLYMAHKKGLLELLNHCYMKLNVFTLVQL